jgi:hypothetical protein
MKTAGGPLGEVIGSMESVSQVYIRSSEPNSYVVLASAMRAIRGLSAELDRTRTERDHLREQLAASERKAQLSEAA